MGRRPKKKQDLDQSDSDEPQGKPVAQAPSGRVTSSSKPGSGSSKPGSGSSRPGPSKPGSSRPSPDSSKPGPSKSGAGPSQPGSFNPGLSDPRPPPSHAAAPAFDAVSAPDQVFGKEEKKSNPTSNSALVIASSNLSGSSKAVSAISPERVAAAINAAALLTEFLADLQAEVGTGSATHLPLSLSSALAGIQHLPAVTLHAVGAAPVPMFAAPEPVSGPSLVSGHPPATAALRSAAPAFVPAAVPIATPTPLSGAALPPATVPAAVLPLPGAFSAARDPTPPTAGFEAKGPAPSDIPDRPPSSLQVQEAHLDAAILNAAVAEVKRPVHGIEAAEFGMDDMSLDGFRITTESPSMVSAQPVAVSAGSARMAFFSPPTPIVTGSFLKGRQTPEWQYYSSPAVWTNGFGFGVSGGGSRACTSAWGAFSSLHSGGYDKFSTFAFMSCNSGGTWCILPLLYAPRPGQQNWYKNSKGRDCTVDQMLGDYVPSAFLTKENLVAALKPELVGYGATRTSKTGTALFGWWDLLDEAFAIPRNIGQGKSPANWQLCTFEDDDAKILEEVTLTTSSNVAPKQLLDSSFTVSARVQKEGYPIPIAVGCANTHVRTAEFWKRFYWVYPVEFTPSCSGVFRDAKAENVKDPLGNANYPDFLISNALFGAPAWSPTQGYKIQADMPTLGFSKRKLGNSSSLSVNEFMAVSSNAPGLGFSPFAYSMHTAVFTPAVNAGPAIKSYEYVDGGAVDNIGLMPLLQRRLSHITVFICNAIAYFGPGSPNFNAISDVSRHFGHPTDVFRASDVTKTAAVYKPMALISACFNPEELTPLYKKLKFSYDHYGTAVATMKHTLAPSQACKDFYGLTGPLYKDYSPIVTWYVVQRPTSFDRPSFQFAPFWASLDPTVFGIYMSLCTSSDNFPYYDTETLLQLNDLQANAMKYYTTAMSDYYMLPHLRKHNTPFHYWVFDSQRIMRKEYFQLDNANKDENKNENKDENSSNGWVEEAFKTEFKQPIVAVAYSPLMQSVIRVYGDGIACGDAPVASQPNVRLKCVLHTVAGIVVGGATTESHRNPNVAFLGIYLYTKNYNEDGVISFSIGSFVEILPAGDNIPKPTKQLTVINALSARVSKQSTQISVPQISVLGGASTPGVALYWTMSIAPQAQSRLLFNSDPKPNIISNATKLNGTKLTLARNDVEVVWCKDPNSASAVQMVVQEKTFDIQSDECRKIFDVAYCPLLNGVLIFYVNAASMLWVQLTQYGKKNYLFPVYIDNEPVPVSFDRSIVFAEFQGNILCVRVDQSIYGLRDAGPLLTHFTLHALDGVKFPTPPSMIY